MSEFTVGPIGTVRGGGEGPATLELAPEYPAGLRGLAGFGHLQVLWWCHQLDTPEARAVTEVPKPYHTAPEVLGIFATRSPVLDVKPYTPGGDRVRAPAVPQWCAHWPTSLEESANFDWAAEFTFAD